MEDPADELPKKEEPAEEIDADKEAGDVKEKDANKEKDTADDEEEDEVVAPKKRRRKALSSDSEVSKILCSVLCLSHTLVIKNGSLR